MKKLLLLLFVPLLFSCGGDGNEDSSKELKFVDVQVTSDDALAPSGTFAIFYIGTDSVTSCGLSQGIYYATLKSGGNTILSVYDKKLSQSTDLSYAGFQLNNLSSLYGTPKAGNYVVYIKLNVGKYPVAWRQFYIDNDKLITVHIPRASYYSETVNATWAIMDYPKKLTIMDKEQMITSLRKQLAEATRLNNALEQECALLKYEIEKSNREYFHGLKSVENMKF